MNYMTVIGAALDIIVVIVILVPVAAGFRSGFKRRLMSLLSLAVSAVVAYVVSNIFSPAIYENYLKDKVTELCTTAVSQIDPVSSAQSVLEEKGISVSDEQIREIMSRADEQKIDEMREIAEEYGYSTENISQLVQQMMEQLPEEAAEAVREQAPQVAEAIENGTIDSSQISDMVRVLADSPEAAAEYAEENYAAPLVTSAVKSVLYAAVFVVMQLIMLMMFAIFGFDLKHKAETSGDRMAGLLIGLVGACANLLVMCIIFTDIFSAVKTYVDTADFSSKVFLPLYNIIY